jgi:7-carboxy-7-deazaguanine synthase (Cx14CxxC type)
VTYSVKEIYYTLQGEGANSGRAAVFCRFAGCNLWSGLERDRATAVCRFCDTDFVGTDGPGGGRFATADELVAALQDKWPLAGGGAGPDSMGLPQRAPPFVVFTGGEPLLQLDVALISALRACGWRLAVETNGTRAVPDTIDWICVSPKAGADLVQRRGDEIKLVYPQQGAMPEDFAGLEFDHYFLQPMAGADLAQNTQRAIAYCKAHPQWRLSVQTHKILGIP